MPLTPPHSSPSRRPLRDRLDRTGSYLSAMVVAWAISLGLLGVVALTNSAASAAPPTAGPWTVRFVYIVSADRRERPEFTRAIAKAAVEVQAFYARQLGGPTFALNQPIVEVVHSDHAAAWFYAHDTGNAKDNWGYDNGLAEANRLLGAAQGQDTTWVIYSDGPGNSGRGGGGVTVMPEDDLLGLVGEHPTQRDPRRWVYGMSHELGHALGLSHPPDLDRVPNAVMGRGFYTCFPDACELTPEDLAVLRTSPFIFAPGDGPRRLATFRYDGGVFTRTRAGNGVHWVETTSERSYRFVERASDDDAYVLDDAGRGLLIKIPRAGGTSWLSTDGGTTWRRLYELSREPQPR